MAQIVIFTGSEEFPFIRPIGAYQVASVLRDAGYTVQVIDDLHHISSRRTGTVTALINKHISEETLWVGFSTTFFNIPRGVTASILQRNPNVKIVVGGSKAWMPAEIFIDCYIEGYADTSVVKYTQWLEGKNPFLSYRTNDNGSMSIVNDHKASSFDFVNHKFSWHESDHILPKEALPIEISRGCIFRCKFCSYPLNGKSKMDYIKDPAILLDEFTENYERFGTTDYVFVDDTFNDSPQKLEILYNNVFSKLPFKLRFGAYLRLDLLRAHPHTIDLLKESGITTSFFGIESMNNESNKIVGKGIKTERLVETLHIVREKWTDTFMVGGFIIGLPHDSEETIRAWVNQLAEPDFPLDTIGIEVLNIYPLKKEENAVWFNDIELNPDTYGYTFTNNSNWINNKGLTKERAAVMKEEFNQLLKKNGRFKHKWTTPFGLHNIGISGTYTREFDMNKFPDIYYQNMKRMQTIMYVRNLLK